MERLQDIIRAKEMVVLKKSERRKRGHEKIEGLDPANNEGGAKGRDCTLILVEGLSAKTYAVWGIQKGVYGRQGRDWYGIYALRGKVLNSRNATPTSVAKNNVVTDIIKSLGLRYNADYTTDDDFQKLRYGKLMIVTDADSVTGETPVLLKRHGMIQIKAIEDVCEEWIMGDNGKEYSSGCYYWAWTENGWSKIKSVMRHKVSKQIYRVSTHSGFVDVTEDHSLVNINNEKITPKELSIGTELLHSLISIQHCYDLDDFHAKAFGAFWITTSYDKLQKSLITEENFIDRENIKEILETYFDKKGRKIIPLSVLNSQKSAKLAFFEAVIERSKMISKTVWELSFKDQITVQCFNFIAKTLGFHTVSDYTDTEYKLIVSSSEILLPNTKNRVKSIVEINPKDQYVYDLETENHHFQAGVGEIIVHNTDGLHISGLIQNLFHSLFPTLLKRDDPFLISMQTPIVRVYLGKSDKLFYDEREYRKYVADNGEKKINKKYYKGLGASNEKDVIETFGQKILEFHEDEKTFDNMNKAFHTKYSYQRKEWLSNYNDDNIVIKWDENKPEKIKVSYSDFINTELIKFSIDDCKRSIPHLMDGLKESHRKVLYVCMLRKLKYSGKTLKVAQLAGSVAEKSGYHHGEQNLYNTITGMAGSFVGSNNIPLLFRDGQFGSRAVGGDDAANARYIYTKLDYLTRLIYREEDDVLLDYLEDDGEKVEPRFYVPIIPMVLVNGCICGIGTGWSSYIPCYNPLELVESVKVWLKYDGNVTVTNEDETVTSLLPEIKPWYRGHTGEMVKEDDTKYVSWGRVENEKKINVVELPVGMWTDDFKDKLETMKEKKEITNYKNYSTPEKVNFILTENQDGIKCDEKSLKLFKYIRTSNMVLFSDESKIRKYENTDEIINGYCRIRYTFYIKRKAYILSQLEHTIKYLGNKKRFLQEVRDGEIKLFKSIKGKRESRSNKEIFADLEAKGYDKDISEEDEENEKSGYEYLLKLQIGSITKEKIDKLENDINSNIEQRDLLAGKTEKDLWKEDLDEFETEYSKWLKQIQNEKTTKKTLKTKAKN